MRHSLGSPSRFTQLTPAAAVGVTDEHDRDFAPIRGSEAPERVSEQLSHSSTLCSNTMISVSISVLTVPSQYQSRVVEPTRDHGIIDLLTALEPEALLQVGPSICRAIRHRLLYFSVEDMDKFLERLERLLSSYAYARSERMQMMAIDFLDATAAIWIRPSVIESDVGHNIRSLCQFFSTNLVQKKIRSWRIRNTLAIFLDRCFSLDPRQSAFIMSDESEPAKIAPLDILPAMCDDDDIRVRTTAGMASAHALALSRSAAEEPMSLYAAIKDQLCTDLDRFVDFLMQF